MKNNKINFFTIYHILFLIFLSSQITCKFGKSLYHTNSELFSKFEILLTTCKNKITKHNLSNDIDNTDKIPYFSFESDEDQTDSQKNIIFMLFGEHSREIIPTEQAYYLSKVLCGLIPEYHTNTIKKILKNTKIYILPILNIHGRKSVENGDYCKRTNENGVDLNRNWDSHWTKSNIHDDSYPGESAFSEWQTEKLKILLKKLQPKTFITSHSGNLGMYSPYAYKKFNFEDLTPQLSKNIKNIQGIIYKINKQYCNCISGSIGNDLGYLCPGTCLDYAFETLRIPYTFAFEIFSEEYTSFYKKILESDKIEYFTYEKFEERNKNNLSINTLIELRSRAGMKTIQLSV